MILEKLLDIIAPNNCLVCEQENGAICLWCLPDAFPPVPDRCFRCMSVNDNSEVCQKCRKKVTLEHVWCATIYKDHAQELIQHMKFNPDRSACYIIARWLDESMPYFEGVVITYVPTAPTRVRQRGFDHAKLIAKEFARLRGLSYKSLLSRVGALRQVGSKKQERLEQAKGAYRLISTKNIPKHVVVIDDIVTTGASLNEVARTLKKGGVKAVDGLVFAQTV